jgi:protein gp37
VTAIRWTDATWNPVTGCSKVSAGCLHCYAETLSLKRGWSQKPWAERFASENVVLHPDRLKMPFAWRTPKRIFVNSMSDAFHDQIPASFTDETFAVMALAPQHTFQILTKRPDQMRLYTRANETPELVEAEVDRIAGERGWHAPPFEWPLPNVWLGTSIESDRWTGRADRLRETEAAVRFISAEPLLGPLPSLDLTGIDWLIVGGESGPGFRRMDHEWARDLRDRALADGVAFFFKQSAGYRTELGVELDGRRWEEYPEG